MLLCGFSKSILITESYELSGICQSEKAIAGCCWNYSQQETHTGYCTGIRLWKRRCICGSFSQSLRLFTEPGQKTESAASAVSAKNLCYHRAWEYRNEIWNKKESRYASVRSFRDFYTKWKSFNKILVGCKGRWHIAAYDAGSSYGSFLRPVLRIW